MNVTLDVSKGRIEPVDRWGTGMNVLAAANEWDSEYGARRRDDNVIYRQVTRDPRSPGSALDLRQQMSLYVRKTPLCVSLPLRVLVQ